jgi:hypothetical protein
MNAQLEPSPKRGMGCFAKRCLIIIAELPVGNYTAIMRGVNNTTGVGLVEVYNLD